MLISLKFQARPPIVLQFNYPKFMGLIKMVGNVEAGADSGGVRGVEGIMTSV